MNIPFFDIVVLELELGSKCIIACLLMRRYNRTAGAWVFKLKGSAVYGSYRGRFTNGMAIDEQLDIDRVYSVLQHEFVHNELYTLTTYGQMVLMLEKTRG